MAGRLSRKHKRRQKKTRRQRRRQRGGAATSSPFFQDAYAITLDPASKRYTDIKAFATAAKVPLQPWKGTVIAAKDRDTLTPLGIGTTNYKDRTGATFNLGVIGAFLGHRTLLQHVAATAADKPGTLIFEDDVEIPPDFYDRLAAVQGEIPADWDFIFLDKLYTDGDKVTDRILKLRKDMTGYKNWGIWAYIVKNASLKDRILPRLEHMLDVPDIQLAKFGDVLNMYLIQPGIVKQDARNAGNSVVTALDTQKGGGDNAPPCSCASCREAGRPAPPPSSYVSSAPMVYEAPGSKIKVFTSADRMKPTLDALLTSLKEHKYSYEVIGMGKPWVNYTTKMRNYLDGIGRYIAEKGNDAMAIFVDAYDVLCIKDSDDVLQTYKSRPRKPPLVFGAESTCLKNCNKGVLKWYDTHKVKGGTAAVEEALKPYKSGDFYIAKESLFMNTGFIMGPASALSSLFQGILNTPYEEDDQYTAGKWSLDHLPEFDMNVEETLVRNKVHTREKLDDEGTPAGPGFVHFPGMRHDNQQADLVNMFKGY